MHDVFISYSHKDRNSATLVLNVLEQNGIRCWIDYRDAFPGDDYAGSLVRAIKNSKFFVLLLSCNSSDSPHVLNEINSAVKACVTIIPFKMDAAEISESMEYYLGKTHWLEALTPPMEAHIKKLVEIIRRYDENMPAPRQGLSIPAKPRQAENNQDCRMVKYHELLAMGYTPSTIAIQLVENDYINCNGIGQENEGTAEQWEEFLQNNTETFQYMVSPDGKIVGDWSVVALTDACYKKAMKGELMEQELDVENTEMICFPGIYHGYILAISVLPEYRSMKNFNLLINSFLKQLEEYSENGIFFDKWCINVFSKEVERLIRQLGFTYVCDNTIYGKIYSCQFVPLPKLPLLKQFPTLCDNYANI